MILTHRPVPHTLSQGYGAGATRGRPHPVYGDYQPVGHLAVDFACPTGTPVGSAAVGAVAYAGPGENMPDAIAIKYGYSRGADKWASGNIVIVDHGDNTATAYSHLSEVHVRAGQRVNGGTVLGLSGMTGRSTGPHLHFEFMTLPINYSSLFYSRLDPMAQYGAASVAPVGSVSARPLLIPDTAEYGPGIPDLFADE